MTFWPSEMRGTGHGVCHVCLYLCVHEHHHTFRIKCVPCTPGTANTHTCQTDAHTQSSKLSYSPLCLDSNASPNGFGCGEQPVENNSCMCQKWESRDSLTLRGPHTYGWIQRYTHLSTLEGSIVNHISFIAFSQGGQT